MLKEAAVNKISTWWKTHTRRACVNALPRIDHLRALSFEDLVLVIRDTISTHRRIAVRLTRQKDLNARVLNSAFMILLHPTRLFNRISVVELRVIQTAAAMLAELEMFRKNMWKDPETYKAAVQTYLDSFDAWKSEERMIRRIEHALVALYKHRRNVVVEEQIEKLRSRLEDLGRLEQFDKLDISPVGSDEDSDSSSSDYC